MKNSAWYQKLWLKKLDELPVKETGSEWAGMKALLDEHMPVSGTPASQPDYSFGTKLIKIFLRYILPGVVIVGAGMYYKLTLSDQNKTNKTNELRGQRADSIKKTGLVYADSIAGQNHADTVRSITPVNDTLVVADDSQKPQSPGDRTKEFISADSSGRKPSTVYSGRNLLRTNASYTHNHNKRGAVVHYSGLKITSADLTTKKGKQTAGHNNNLVHAAGNMPSFTGLPNAPSKGAPLVDHNLTAINNAGVNLAENQGLKNNQPAMPSLSPNELLPAPNGKVGNRDKGADKASLTVRNNEQQSETSIGNGNKAHKQKKTTGNQNAAKSKETTAKPMKNKLFKVKGHQEIITPQYNYGIETGLNVGGGNSGSFYFGGFGAYALTSRLLINTGVRFNTYRAISGSFTHNSYYRPDSLPPFTVIDARKVIVLDLPITVEYKLSNLLSIKAGPVISFPLKQSAVSTKLAPIGDLRDTVYHSAEIKSALNSTSLNKVNIGFTGGVTLHVRKFDISGNYQLLKPYQISTSLGNYSKTYQTFQVGIGWRFH